MLRTQKNRSIGGVSAFASGRQSRPQNSLRQEKPSIKGLQRQALEYQGGSTSTAFQTALRFWKAYKREDSRNSKSPNVGTFNNGTN